MSEVSALAAMSFDIVPYESVGPLRFGMTRRQVIARLGACDEEVDDDIMEEIRLSWPGLVCYFQPKSLVAVLFSTPLNVTLSGLSLFAVPGLLNQLAALDPAMDDAGQYANCPALGVCLGGFGRRRIPEGKLVQIYAASQAKFYEGFIRA